MIGKILATGNRPLEDMAVQLCAIQPGETVLEVGHGPGVGLESAARLLTDPSGHLIGVDYSQYMHKVASERLKALLASGKVTLHLCDIAATPLADNTVDKLFHVNSYFYWPDLRKCAAELHRVMKPGGMMVTTMRISHVLKFGSKKVLPGETWHPDAYMSIMRQSGFTDVRMEDTTQKSIQAIFATASK